jgi:hypothetical protein
MHSRCGAIFGGQLVVTDHLRHRGSDAAPLKTNAPDIAITKSLVRSAVFGAEVR